MNKLDILNDSSFKNNNRNEENQKINASGIEHEKILCDHCGRTAGNGIRCLGMCVADNDY